MTSILLWFVSVLAMSFTMVTLSRGSTVFLVFGVFVTVFYALGLAVVLWTESE